MKKSFYHNNTTGSSVTASVVTCKALFSSPKLHSLSLFPPPSRMSLVVLPHFIVRITEAQRSELIVPGTELASERNKI